MMSNFNLDNDEILAEARKLLNEYGKARLLEPDPKQRANLADHIKQILEDIETHLAHKNRLTGLSSKFESVQRELKEALNHTLLPVSLSPFLVPLQRYDDFFRRFFHNLNEFPAQEKDRNHILKSLKIATQAQQVFVVRGNSNKPNFETIESTLSNDADLHNLITDAFTSDISAIGVHAGNFQVCLFKPVSINDKTKEMLVFYGIDLGFELDAILEYVVYILLELTENLTKRKPSEFIEIGLYNALKKRFGYVSNYMYERQFDLFKRRLHEMTISFERIIRLSPTEPTISGWEALARDTTKKAPQDLFQTAELWGTRFQVELDMYFLSKAVHSYERKSPAHVLPLSVNVYPGTLLRPNYLKLVMSLEMPSEEAESIYSNSFDDEGKAKNTNDTSRSLFTLDKLFLEVSEKMAIPEPEKGDRFSSFNTALEEFSKLGVQFTVDDFGVGHATSSRIWQMRPACIKVDREALLDNYGKYIIEHALNLSRKMSSGMKVVIEGVDERISLKELYDLGVRYVQGYKFGLAVEKIDNELSEENKNMIREALKAKS
jgi:EAL domain-containing protein (putative c-di-GMP-specific phosphodiesterase class I)